MPETADTSKPSGPTQGTPPGASRTDSLVLAAGLALYLVTLVVCGAVLGAGSERGARGVAVLSAPVALAVIALLLAQLAVFLGIGSGTPWVSFTYGFSLIKHNWKLVVGVVLLLTALCAALAAASA